MIRKYRIFPIVLVVVFLTSSLMICAQTSDEINGEEELLLLAKYEGNEERVDSRSIIDEFGNIHLFIRVIYGSTGEGDDNSSFIIFHSVNNKVTQVAFEENADDYFEVFLVSGGLVLFYSFHTFYGTSKYYMYVWSPSGAELHEYHTTNELFSFNPSLCPSSPSRSRIPS